MCLPLKDCKEERKEREMERPTRIKLKMYKGEVVTPYDVHITRSCYMGGWKLNKSKWHNPFSVKEHGLEGALNLYWEYMTRGEGYALILDLPELAGKKIGCFCELKDHCHGNYLIEIGRQPGFWL